jgi:hypothetical protein
MTTTITSAKAHELFDYSNGVLYWKTSPRNGWTGKPVNHKTSNGYLKAKVDGKLIPVHRLVWLLHYGDTPELIDHINGIRHDNRIENLRICNDSENARNRAKSSNNTSGYQNVVWNKSNRNYNVQITVNKRKMHIGVFDDVELAALVAEEARHKFFGEFARKGA